MKLNRYLFATIAALLVAAVAFTFNPVAVQATQDTQTSTQADSAFPVFKPQGSRALGVATGHLQLTTPLDPTDILQMVRVPAGACVVDGYVKWTELDLADTATLDMDIGYAANGTESASTAAFGNMGVWNAYSVSNLQPVTAIGHFVLSGDLAAGPVCLTNETIIQVYVNAAAAAWNNGSITLGVYYYVP